MFQSLRATHINDLRGETYGEKERRERRKDRNKKEYMPMGVPTGILYDGRLPARRLQLPTGEKITVAAATPEQFRALLHEMIKRIVIIKKGIVDVPGTVRIQKVTMYRLLGEGESLGLSDTHIEQVLAGVTPITPLDNLESKWYALDLMWRLLRVHPDSLFVSSDDGADKAVQEPALHITMDEGGITIKSA